MELPRRNGLAVEQALRSMEERIYEQSIRINGLNASLATLHSRLDALEAAEARRRIASMGTGPTA